MAERMKTETVNGYEIAGNEFLAIAINVENPKDAHYFTPGEQPFPSIPGLDAFERAVVWTSPGL
jgi:hypothetical protein